MKSLEEIVKENLGVTLGEDFLIKMPKNSFVASWYEQEWLSVYINDLGYVCFSEEGDNPHSVHPLERAGKQEIINAVSYAGLEENDEDFFWRVTLGQLLAGTFEIKKIVPVTVQTTVNFLKMQEIEYIKTVQDEERNAIAFALGGKNANFTGRVIRKDDILLYKPIKEIYKYICRGCEKYNVTISLSKLEENFDF